MKTLRAILVGLGVLLFVLLAVSQLMPSTYHVERSVLIQARPDAIHPWIHDLKRWPEWSAWTTAKDPTLEYRYEGSEAGVGAVSKWEGKKMGQGEMTLTESDPQKGVKFNLSFEQGKYRSIGFFAFEPEGDATKVTWGFDGDVSRNPLDRYFSLLMDKMVGPDFEEGLRNLKQKVETK
jgi:hypothetical protein